MSHLAKSLFYGFKFEQRPKFYKKTGVHQFKKILPGGDYWVRLYNFYFQKTKKKLNQNRTQRIGLFLL